MKGTKVLAMALAGAMVIASLAGCGTSKTADTSSEVESEANVESSEVVDGNALTQNDAGEIVYKGQTGGGDDNFNNEPQDVYWIDASVQIPEQYTKIVGFKLTATMTQSDYYGGGKEDQTMECGLILTTKGAHTPDEYSFTYPDDQFPHYDLSNKEIVGIGVGDAGFVATMAFGTGLAGDSTVRQGDTFTVTYEGNSALFEEGDPTMTVVSFLGVFEYESIEWILGEPVALEEKEWKKIPTVEYLDVATVSDDIQNGCNYVDITIPDLGLDSYPVVLWIHGGGYVTGTRKNCILSNTKEYLLNQGYAFVSVEYTLTETENVDANEELTGFEGQTVVYKKGGMPDMLNDVKAAVRFLRSNAEEYHLNTDFIAAMGESAGAGLALLMGTTNGSADHEDLSMGYENYSSDVQAAVSVCGPTNFTGDYIGNMAAYIGEEIYQYEENKQEIDAKARLWSATEQVSAMSAPLYLTYSKADTTVPFSHAEDLVEMTDLFMDSEDVKKVFYSQGGHVERGTFDTYTAYVTLAEWLNEKSGNVAPDLTNVEEAERIETSEVEIENVEVENTIEVDLAACEQLKGNEGASMLVGVSTLNGMDATVVMILDETAGTATLSETASGFGMSFNLLGTTEADITEGYGMAVGEGTITSNDDGTLNVSFLDGALVFTVVTEDGKRTVSMAPLVQMGLIDPPEGE